MCACEWGCGDAMLIFALYVGVGCVCVCVCVLVVFVFVDLNLYAILDVCGNKQFLAAAETRTI